MYAIKEFTYTEADLPNIEREIDIMYQLKSHPNIISIKEDHKTTGNYGEQFMNIILEFAGKKQIVFCSYPNIFRYGRPQNDPE